MELTLATGGSGHECAGRLGLQCSSRDGEPSGMTQSGQAVMGQGSPAHVDAG